jgi:hypothetical protein
MPYSLGMLFRLFSNANTDGHKKWLIAAILCLSKHKGLVLRQAEGTKTLG